MPWFILLTFLVFGPAANAQLMLNVTLKDSNHDLKAVAPDGTAFAVQLDDADSNLYASTDGARTWTLRGVHPKGSSFAVVTALSDGVLLADTLGEGHALSRSTDGGATWTDVLPLAPYRMLSPHSIDEIRGVVYFVEYQDFTLDDTPIHLWASGDRGATWSVVSTLTGHRHAHAVRADPASGALWLFFGDTDPQCAILRSLDDGASWTTVLAGTQSADVVDALVSPTGAIFGLDASYLPSLPFVERLNLDGTFTQLTQLPGPSYSIHQLSGGSTLVGVTREPDGDIYPPDEISGHIFGSIDGATFADLLQFPRIDPSNYARADVYWELGTGEAVVNVGNAQGFGAGGRGYLLVTPAANAPAGSAPAAQADAPAAGWAGRAATSR